MSSEANAPARAAGPADGDAAPAGGGARQGHDEEIAVIFREMRRASEKSLDELSALLKTPQSTLTQLESGSVAGLPSSSNSMNIG